MISISGYDTKYKNSDKAFNGIEKEKDGTITKKQKGALKQNMKKGDKLTVYLLFLYSINVTLKSSKLLHVYSNTQDKHLVVDTTANNIKQFICNGLLTTLVVLQVEFAQEFIGIIRSSLHSHHSSSMFAG